MWVAVQDDETPANLRRTTKFAKPTNARDMDTYSSSNFLGRNEKKRDPNVKNQCHFYATTVTSKNDISASSTKYA